jgi:hypothetical protein
VHKKHGVRVRPGIGVVVYYIEELAVGEVEIRHDLLEMKDEG